jgi:hypothetical protein
MIRKEVMESLDILILGVEASIALAGFAGIIATFQFGGAKQTRRADAVGLTIILQFSLLAALASSIAILLSSFDIKETTLWAICSVVIAIMYVGGIYAQHKNLKDAVRTASFKKMIAILRAPGPVLILINVMNASDIFFHREAGPVIAGIVWALTLAGFMFSRLLLQPVWRNVRIQEAAKLADATPG